MKEKIDLLKQEINEKVQLVDNLKDLNELRIIYLGKKGPISELLNNMKDLNIDEKKEVGRLVNELKTEVNNLFDSIKNKLEKEELDKKLASEKIDISLPATKIPVGSASIIETVVEELEELMMSMGYDVVEGPEVEKDLYNFELLNLPKGHPARDAQDTFYVKDDTMLLRSQTSPVQVRTMLEAKGEKPIRIICPGKTYRRDEDDATHSHQFTQCEGLLVEKENISLANLKATFEVIDKKLFGEDREVRFRPSYYPFTEPSVEMDVSCFNCGQKGCNICKGTGWITVGGAGIVNHKVLDNCGYDSTKWSGFAFGFGVERLAMLKYGINDVRALYNNDLKVAPLYNRRDV